MEKYCRALCLVLAAISSARIIATYDALSLTGSLSYTHTHILLSGTRSRFLNDDGGFGWTGDDGLKYYNPAYLAIMRNCANAEIGVWSENNLDRTVVVAVYGQPT